MMQKEKLYFVFTIVMVAAMPVSNRVFAQASIDKAIYRCQYRATTLLDTLDAGFTSVDIMNLDIGENTALFYSSRKEELEAYKKKLREGGSFDIEQTRSSTKGVKNYKIYINYPDKKITYQDELIGRKNRYYYKEDLLKIDWTVTAEKKMILKYNCQKATCTYMGRNYEAWFTTEIPIKFGPYKFGGLPGLIVELYDTKKHYMFEIIGFEQLKSPENILYNLTGFQEISKNEFLKIEYFFVTDPISFLSQNSGITIEGISTARERGKETLRQNAYLPIELKK